MVKTSGGDRRLRPSTWIRDHPERGEEQEVFRGLSDGLSSPKPSSRWLNTGRCGSQKWFLVYRRRLHLSSSRGTQSQTAHAERRKISYSVEVHRRYQNNTYVNWCIVEKTDWWLLERGWRKRIIRCMDRIYMIYFVEWKAKWWIHMVREETYKETQNFSSWWCVARYVEAYVWCSEKQSNKKVGYRETKLDNARQLRGIFFFELEDEEFRDIIKNARRKLEIPMPASNAL